MQLRGTNQEFGRPYNRRIVLETIRLKAPISRADIARQVGLTLQTVSTITAELQRAGLLTAVRESGGRRGQPAILLTLRPEGGFVIGLQLSHSRLEAALIDLAGTIVGRESVALTSSRPDAVLPIITRVVAAMRTQEPARRVLDIGIAMPGPFDVESMSFVPPTTIEGWRGVATAEIVSRATGLPVFISNDAAAAALGEGLYGVGTGFRNFYYIYFGVGLGGCMIRDGHAELGAYGNAGEIGHMPVVPFGDLCSCGNRGCLERYVSIEALHRRLIHAGTDPAVGLDELCRRGDPTVEAWIAEAVELLRRAIVTIENLFDPEVTVIGGYLPDQLATRIEVALQPLPHSIAERIGRRSARVIRATISQDVVVRGAAALAVSGVFSPRFGLLFADAAGREERDPIVACNPTDKTGELPSVEERA